MKYLCVLIAWWHVNVAWTCWKVDSIFECTRMAWFAFEKKETQTGFTFVLMKVSDRPRD